VELRDLPERLARTARALSLLRDPTLNGDARSSAAPMVEARVVGAPDILIGPLIRRDRRVVRYGGAVLIVLATGGLRLALTPVMGAEAPLLPFLLAVLFAAYIGGRGPALLATVLAPLLVTPIFTAWPHSIALSAGFDCHFTKPVDPAQLLARIAREALELRQATLSRKRFAGRAEFDLARDALGAWKAVVRAIR
jgi:hypothetical protein